MTVLTISKTKLDYKFFSGLLVSSDCDKAFGGIIGDIKSSSAQYPE